jgi:hypothetical protein
VIGLFLNSLPRVIEIAKLDIQASQEDHGRFRQSVTALLPYGPPFCEANVNFGPERYYSSLSPRLFHANSELPAILSIRRAVVAGALFLGSED